MCNVMMTVYGLQWNRWKINAIKLTEAYPYLAELVNGLMKEMTFVADVSIVVLG